MTQEEKAKAYDEALERAKKFEEKYGGGYAGYIFPELAESEDERIRKEIRDFILYNAGKDITEETEHRWVTWLEKQKEKPTDAKLERVIKASRSVLNNWLDGTDCPDVSGDFAELEYAIREYDGEEKQKEQKPSDMPPGFYFIDLDGKKFYSKEFRYGDMKMKVAENEKEQKPADLSKMMVHKEPYIAPVPTPMVADEQKAVSYSPLCNTIKDKIREYVANNFVTDTVVKTDVKSIVKAMEEGVRLGKEEQKPVDYDHEMWKNCEANFEGGKKEVIEHPEKYGLQKPAEWSKEDEKRVKQLIYDTEAIRAGYEKRKESLGDDFNDELIKDCDEQINWLKSLRPSWKPSEDDIKMLEHIIEQYEIGNKNSKVMGYLPRVEELDFLKKVLAKWKNLL